jgi:hypothetical protein
MFIYEYDTNNGAFSKKPAHAMPYAVLTYQLENPDVHDKKIYAKQIP